MDITNEEMNIKRSRRHTIARPLSALGLLTDSMECDQANEDYQFDRISHILSSLIQEANEAVTSKSHASTTRPSSLPLVRKLSSSSSSDQQRYHKKRSSYRGSARPMSYPSGLRRSKTPSYTNVNSTMANKKSTVCLTKQKGAENSLTKSFERLNSSMAIIDSLSRDLAVSEILRNNNKSDESTVAKTINYNKVKATGVGVKQDESKKLPTHWEPSNTKAFRKPISIDPRLSALILLPLLHVPHILIATAFDSLSTHENGISSSTTGAKLSGLFMWAFVLAITNLVVDKGVITVPVSITRISEEKINRSKAILPGSFIDSKSLQYKKRNMSHRQGQSMQLMHQNQFYMDHSALQHPLSHGNFLNQNTQSLKRRNSL